jgi:hypothetical protein
MPESFSLAKGLPATIGLIAKLTTRLHSLRGIVEGCDSLVQSLSPLAEVLKHVQSTFGDSLVSMNSTPKDATLLKECVQNCHSKCSQLQRCLESIQFASVPHFKALKEEKNIDSLKGDIESDKSTLALLMGSIAYVLNFNQLCVRSRPANLLPFCLVRSLGARVRLDRSPLPPYRLQSPPSSYSP